MNREADAWDLGALAGCDYDATNGHVDLFAKNPFRKKKMNDPLLLSENGFPLPTVLPKEWVVLGVYENAMTYACQRGPQRGLFVIGSLSREKDGKRWLHVSMGRQDRIPHWGDVRAVKDMFIGRKLKAIQVLPSEDEYVNIHPFALHLWHCLDDDGLPDFRDEDGKI